MRKLLIILNAVARDSCYATSLLQRAGNAIYRVVGRPTQKAGSRSSWLTIQGQSSTTDCDDTREIVF